MPTASLASSLLVALGQLAPPTRLSTQSSWIAVAFIGLVLGSIFLTAVFGEWRARARTAALRRAIEGKIGPLAPGNCVLKGTIETDAPDGRAIAIELLQVGADHVSAQGTHHSWTEVARRVDARPFYLRLEDGRLVRVEPDSRTFVVDALDGVKRTDRNQRVRSAEVKHGDHVFVIGTLVEGFDPRAQIDGGYRGANGKSLVVRAPRGRSMLVSTEVPTQRHMRKEGFHGNWALGIATLLLMVHGLAFGNFYLLAFTGTPVEATVTELARRYHRSKTGGYYSYRLIARYENVSGNTVTVSDEVSPLAAYDEAVSPGSRVTFTVSTASARVAQVGRAPGVSVLAVILAAFAAIFTALLYVLSVLSSRPWYERKRVVERGAGPSALSTSA
jgi:hypothetical protein